MPVFGARARARELQDETEALHREVESLRAQLDRLGAMSVVELKQRRAAAQAELEQLGIRHADAERQHQERLVAVSAASEVDRRALEQRLAELRREVVVTEETAILQEVGIYTYRHPLDDAVAYQAELARLRDSIKLMARANGGAVEAATNWTVNNSATEGRRMVADFSKLLLRAYNAEADNLVRGLKPYKLESAIDRLTKVAHTIAKLGKTMNIRISGRYHQLRVKELELTADYVEKAAQEREREREEKARLREERLAQQELERERAKLSKELEHYENAMKALIAKGDQDGAARMQSQLDDIQRAIEDVDYRAANVRAGYVYVISNLGSFGEHMIKVGMTRRLEPRDRIRELSDASVPFNFDTHALFFAEDAVGIEAEMHRRLADKRVNKVNHRREFFHATPAEAKQHLLELAGDLLQYEDLPEALEFHQSASRI